MQVESTVAYHKRINRDSREYQLPERFSLAFGCCHLCDTWYKAADGVAVTNFPGYRRVIFACSRECVERYAEAAESQQIADE